jgi:hypothetical protein
MNFESNEEVQESDFAKSSPESSSAMNMSSDERLQTSASSRNSNSTGNRKSQQKPGAVVAPLVSVFDNNARYNKILKEGARTPDDRAFMTSWAQRLAREGTKQDIAMRSYREQKEQEAASSTPVDLGPYTRQSETKDAPTPADEERVNALTEEIAKEKEEQANKEAAEGQPPQKKQRAGNYRTVGMRRTRRYFENEAQETALQLNEQEKTVAELVKLMQSTETKIEKNADQLAMDTKDIPAPTLALLRTLSVKLVGNLKTMKKAREDAEIAARKARSQADDLKTKYDALEANKSLATTKLEQDNARLEQENKSLATQVANTKSSLENTYNAIVKKLGDGYAAESKRLNEELATATTTSNNLQIALNTANARLSQLELITGQRDDANRRIELLQTEKATEEQKAAERDRKHREAIRDMANKLRQKEDELAIAQQQSSDAKNAVTAKDKELLQMSIALGEMEKKPKEKLISKDSMTFYNGLAILLKDGPGAVYKAGGIRFPLVQGSDSPAAYQSLLDDYVRKNSADLSDQINDLQVRINRAVQEAQEAKKRADKALQDQQAEYDRQLQEAKTRNNDLEVANQKLNTAVSTGNNDKAELEARVKALETTNTGLQKLANEAERKRSTVQQGLFAAESSITALNAQLAALSGTSSENTQLNADLKRLRDENSRDAVAKLAEIAKLKNDVAALTRRVEESETKLGTREAEIVNLNQQATDLTNVVAATVKRVANAPTPSPLNENNNTLTAVIDGQNNLIAQKDDEIQRLRKKLRLAQDEYSQFFVLTDAAVLAVSNVGWRSMFPHPFYPYSPPSPFTRSSVLALSVFAACSDKVFGDMLADALGENYVPWIPLHVHVAMVLRATETTTENKNHEGLKRTVYPVLSILIAYRVMEERIRAYATAPPDTSTRPLDPLTTTELNSLNEITSFVSIHDIQNLILACMHAAALRAKNYTEQLTGMINSADHKFPSRSSQEEKNQLVLTLQQRMTSEPFCRALVKNIRQSPRLKLFWRYDGNPMDIIKPMLSLPGMADAISAAASSVPSGK